MRVDHRRRDVLVAKEILDRPYVLAVFEKVGREGMPSVTTKSFSPFFVMYTGSPESWQSPEIS